MEFEVVFYETVNGHSPVKEFLLELKASDRDDFAAVAAGLEKLRHRQYHREPLTKALGDGLFELRHVGKLNTRVLWFFVKGRRIIAVHGIRNKGHAIPAHDLGTAEKRMRDWQERNDLSARRTLTFFWKNSSKTPTLPSGSNAPARRGTWPCNSRRCAKKPAFPKKTSRANSTPPSSRSAGWNRRPTKAIP